MTGTKTKSKKKAKRRATANGSLSRASGSNDNGAAAGNELRITLAGGEAIECGWMRLLPRLDEYSVHMFAAEPPAVRFEDRCAGELFVRDLLRSSDVGQPLVLREVVKIERIAPGAKPASNGAARGAGTPVPAAKRGQNGVGAKSRRKPR